MKTICKAKKISIYINKDYKTMQQIKTETGCDYIINGGLYDMSTFKPVCHLKVDGVDICKPDPYWRRYGIGWTGTKVGMSLDMEDFDNYITCVELVYNGKAVPLSYDSALGGKRQNTGFGVMPDGRVWLFSQQTGITPEDFQKEALTDGVLHAVKLDGGGSTQCVLSEGTLTSSRKVHNFICVWEDKNSSSNTVSTTASINTNEIKINIDAGHGYNTEGKYTAPFTEGIDINGDNVIDVKKGERFKEHWANVMVSDYLAKALEYNGYSIMKTGWNDVNAADDYDTSLSSRQAAIAAGNCDASISVHFNAYGNGDSFNSAEGVVTFIHSTQYKNSKGLAQFIQSYLAEGTKQTNRGVQQQAFAMCNCNSMKVDASVLVECAFMTNEKEAQTMMANDDFAYECAQAICQGVCEYYGSAYKKSPFYASTMPQESEMNVNSNETSKENETYNVMVTASSLNVRSGKGTTYPIVGVLKKNTVLSIYETSGNWGRCSQGWISLTYTKEVTEEVADSGETVVADEKVLYNVTIKASSLNVRTGPGIAYSKVGTYNKGEKISIYQEKYNWLKTDKGWISGTYCTKVVESVTFTPYQVKVKCSVLNIRAGAALTKSIVGTYKKNDILTIINVSGLWSQTEKGWVYSSYLTKI